MTDLVELKARVDAATGPSRELDIALAISLGWKRVSQGFAVSPDGEAYAGPPLWTASLDAALALVERLLPGVWISLTQYPDCWAASISEGGHMASAPTPALAVLSALLSALIAKQAEPVSVHCGEMR